MRSGHHRRPHLHRVGGLLLTDGVFFPGRRLARGNRVRQGWRWGVSGLIELSQKCPCAREAVHLGGPRCGIDPPLQFPLVSLHFATDRKPCALLLFGRLQPVRDLALRLLRFLVTVVVLVLLRQWLGLGHLNASYRYSIAVFLPRCSYSAVVLTHVLTQVRTWHGSYSE